MALHRVSQLGYFIIYCLCYFVTLFSAWTLALFAWPRIICNKSHRRPQVRVHECPKTAKVFSPTVIVARKVALQQEMFLYKIYIHISYYNSNPNIKCQLLMQRISYVRIFTTEQENNKVSHFRLTLTLCRICHFRLIIRHVTKNFQLKMLQHLTSHFRLKILQQVFSHIRLLEIL